MTQINENKSEKDKLLKMDIMEFHREYGKILPQREWRQIDRVLGRMYHLPIKRVGYPPRAYAGKQESNESRMDRVNNLYSLSEKEVMRLARCGPKSIEVLNKMLRGNHLPPVSSS